MFGRMAEALAMNGWPDENDVAKAKHGDVKQGAASQPSRSTSRETLERSTQMFCGRNLSSAVDPRCWCLRLGAKDERKYGSAWLARPR